MLSSGVNVFIWDEMLSSGANVIIWDEMLSSGMKCYHLGLNVSIWDEMLSSGMQCYHLELMLSSGTKGYHLELILWYGANVIIWTWCYHLVLSCDVIIWDDNTPLFYFSWKLHTLKNLSHCCLFNINLIWQLMRIRVGRLVDKLTRDQDGKKQKLSSD